MRSLGLAGVALFAGALILVRGSLIVVDRPTFIPLVTTAALLFHAASPDCLVVLPLLLTLLVFLVVAGAANTEDKEVGQVGRVDFAWLVERWRVVLRD